MTRSTQFSPLPLLRILRPFVNCFTGYRPDHVNRVILLSDGLANVGIIDPSQIAALAQRIRENSVSVSTMGVGVDFNETLMANVADHSGGNYYYISKDVNMADVFRREW